MPPVLQSVPSPAPSPPLPLPLTLLAACAISPGTDPGCCCSCGGGCWKTKKLSAAVAATSSATLASRNALARPSAEERWEGEREAGWEGPWDDTDLGITIGPEMRSSPWRVLSGWDRARAELIGARGLRGGRPGLAGSAAAVFTAAAAAEADAFANAAKVRGLRGLRGQEEGCRPGGEDGCGVRVGTAPLTLLLLLLLPLALALPPAATTVKMGGTGSGGSTCGDAGCETSWLLCRVKGLGPAGDSSCSVVMDPHPAVPDAAAAAAETAGADGTWTGGAAAAASGDATAAIHGTADCSYTYDSSDSGLTDRTSEMRSPSSSTVGRPGANGTPFRKVPLRLWSCEQ